MVESFFPSRFRILEEITSNDAEIVVRARDEILEREVFLKRLGAGVRGLPGSERTRAMREAKALARIKHKSVLSILDVFETESAIILEIEPVSGETLADRLERDAPLPIDEVIEITAEVADAMAAVHAEGIVHRNICTENIILRPEGGICLTGFSFAKPGDSNLSQSSIDYRALAKKKVNALPKHPSPEQVSGQVADARSDIFGIGCVLYECLSGEVAFPWGASSSQIGDLARFRPELPKGLKDVVAKCLVQSPIGRYSTAGALQEALISCAKADGAGTRGRRWVLPTSMLASCAALLLGLYANGVFDVVPDNGRGPMGPDPVAKPAQYSGTYSNSYALLIADNYEKNPDFDNLNNAENDIEAIHTVLESLGWEVKRLSEGHATRRRIREELEKLEDKEENSQVLVYFAGHGKASDKSLSNAWLIPPDATSSSRANWIRFAEFEDWFRECDAKHIMVMLDCCYSGTLTRGRSLAREGEMKPKEVSKYLEKRVRVVLSSAGPDEEAKDGPKGKHSPFAKAFLDALADRSTTYITSTELNSRILDTFKNDRNQTPQFRKYEGTEFVFYKDLSKQKPK